MLFFCLNPIFVGVTAITSNDGDETALHQLMTAASERVWNVFYKHKKEVWSVILVFMFLIMLVFIYFTVSNSNPLKNVVKGYVGVQKG